MGQPGDRGAYGAARRMGRWPRCVRPVGRGQTVNQERLRMLGWGAAGVLAAVGVLWSIGALMNRGEPARRLTRRAGDLRELQALQRVVARRDAGLARFHS